MRPARSLALAVALAVALGPIAVAQSVNTTANQFVVPPPGNGGAVFTTYAPGTNITIAWETEWKLVDLVIWQNGPNVPLQYLDNSRTPAQVTPNSRYMPC